VACTAFGRRVFYLIVQHVSKSELKASYGTCHDSLLQDKSLLHDFQKLLGDSFSRKSLLRRPITRLGTRASRIIPLIIKMIATVGEFA